MSTPVGEIILAGDRDRLSQLHLITDGGSRPFALPSDWVAAPLFREAEEQLQQYFQKKRRAFDLPLDPQGTDFQKSVWKALRNIPYGRVASYKAIAREIGCEKGARAVGLANARNPLPIIIPCHRVIGSNGSLGGFAYGLRMKKMLLQLEENPGSDGADQDQDMQPRLF